MKLVRYSILVGLIGGVIITLVTGMIPNKVLLGATHYGFPLVWITRLALGPENFPWRFNILGLVGNIIFWSVISTVIFGLFRSRKRHYRLCMSEK
jgi:hypothetical protein